MNTKKFQILVGTYLISLLAFLTSAPSRADFKPIPACNQSAVIGVTKEVVKAFIIEEYSDQIDLKKLTITNGGSYDDACAYHDWVRNEDGEDYYVCQKASYPTLRVSFFTKRGTPMSFRNEIGAYRFVFQFSEEKIKDDEGNYTGTQCVISQYLLRPSFTNSRTGEIVKEAPEVNFTVPVVKH